MGRLDQLSCPLAILFFRIGILTVTYLNQFADELPYILNDKDYLLKYKSDLKSAVLRAKASPQALLKGYDVCISAHVQPPAKTLSAIVMSAGGKVSPYI